MTWSQQTSQTGVLSLRGLDFPQDATTGFCVGDSGRVVRTNRPLMLTGWYTGDGTDNRPITEVGFQPDFVIINGDNELTVCRTSTMTDDESKQFYTAVGLQANWIQTFDTDGFTIGSADEVNADGTTYSWSAFKARGELKVGTYLGTGSDDTSFTGIGFEPDYLIVLSEGSDLAMQRFPGAVDETFPFTNGSGVPFTNMIQAMEADGFELGDSVTVNRLNTTYHYVACTELPLQIEVGSYAGVGGDDVSITGPGFSPDMLLIKSVTAEDPVLRMRSMGSGEKTHLFSASANLPDEIQAFEPNGFQVGSTDRVNESATTYNWVAFRRDPLQPSPRVLVWTEVDPH